MLVLVLENCRQLLRLALRIEFVRLSDDGHIAQQGVGGITDRYQQIHTVFSLTVDCLQCKNEVFIFDERNDILWVPRLGAGHSS